MNPMAEDPSKREAPTCPNCGADHTIPIAYGMPAPEMREAADHDEIHIGGCVIIDSNPIWHCRKCGHEWR